MEAISVPGVEEVHLVIRNVNGIDMVFTSDGKILANQGSGGHIYYTSQPHRRKTFRTAFLVDHKKVDMGEKL